MSSSPTVWTTDLVHSALSSVTWDHEDQGHTRSRRAKRTLGPRIMGQHHSTSAGLLTSKLLFLEEEFNLFKLLLFGVFLLHPV